MWLKIRLRTVETFLVFQKITLEHTIECSKVTHFARATWQVWLAGEPLLRPVLPTGGASSGQIRRLWSRTGNIPFRC
jgi:hypothetical protein